MIKEIRERLSKITQGKWCIRNTLGAPEIVTKKRSIAKVLYHNGSEDSEVDANADFIANAPSDIAFLLGEVERLTAERDKTEYALQKMTESRGYCKELLDKQMARNEGLYTHRNKWKRRSEALERAIKHQHVMTIGICFCCTHFMDDCGGTRSPGTDYAECVGKRWEFDEVRFSKEDE